jgi:hypothetical protein
MEQNKMSPNGEGRGQGRFGNHRVPNQYSPINLANNAIYNQLGLEAGLDIALGVNMCFYVNKLDHRQSSDLITSFPNNTLKGGKKQDIKPANWLSATSYSSFGKNPSDIFTESIDLYNSFDIEQEAKRIASYGISTLAMDFSKLPLLKEAKDGWPAYPFGIMFFSDLNNGFDSFNATISTIPERRKDVSRYPYIMPINYDSRGKASCTGKYRIRGNFIIFYVTKEIEKQEGLFFPDVTIINVPVSLMRESKENWHIIKSVYACNIKKASNCVLTGFVEYIVQHIFGFYGFTDAQPIAEIIHAFGYDPMDYSYPPSASDERSKYYGGNHVHVGTRSNFTRREKPVDHNTNIFNYLNEINKKNETSIIVSAKKEPDNTKRRDKKTKPPEEEEVISEQEIDTQGEGQIQDIMPQYSNEEIDAAFGGVAEGSPIQVGDGEAPHPPELPSEDGGEEVVPGELKQLAIETDEIVNDAQDEEFPQGENNNVQEEDINNGE